MCKFIKFSRIYLNFKNVKDYEFTHFYVTYTNLFIYVNIGNEILLKDFGDKYSNALVCIHIYVC